jgi:hypothetical protein
MIIIEIILMGVFATLFMDLLAGFLSKRKLIFSFIEPEAIGRWFLYMFKGKFRHQNIHKTPSLKNEKLWCFISHYLIGIFLAGLYLFVELIVPSIRDQVWIVLVFGIATVFFPWFWLLPGIGIGFMASKSQKRSLILRSNLVNHTMFGLGLFLWIIFIHRFFI